jgi:hypothetical protein
MAIAALARAAREPSGGDLDTSQYAEAARRGYLHLREHNLAYLDDGVENIIDDYCALLAAVELTRTLGAEWLAEARIGPAGCAPASAPTPISATIGPPTTMARAPTTTPPRRACRCWRCWSISPSSRIRRASGRPGPSPSRPWRPSWPAARAGNPFALARQYVKGVDEAPRVSFFMPHHNESGYWWQGRTPGWRRSPPWRLLPHSTCRAERTAAHLRPAPARLDPGRNPFNACMLAGQGINNPEYTAGYPNAQGDLQRHHRRLR